VTRLGCPRHRLAAADRRHRIGRIGASQALPPPAEIFAPGSQYRASIGQSSDDRQRGFFVALSDDEAFEIT